MKFGCLFRDSGKEDFVYDLHMVSIDGYQTPVIITPVQGFNDKRPVCFVVGLATHYLDKFSDKFLSIYRLVFIDLYWTKNDLTSPRKSFPDAYIEDLTLDKIALHISIVQESLRHRFGAQYRRVFVAGHSSYGLVAMVYACRYPRDVYGAFAMGTPCYIDAKKIACWEREYMQKKFFGTPRYDAYLKFVKSPPFNPWKDRDAFVQSYVDVGFTYWKTDKLWQNQNNVAKNIWNPWEAKVKMPSGEVRTLSLDLNLTIFPMFFKLISNKYYLGQIFERIQVPVLWIIGTYDSRISKTMIESVQQEGVRFSQNFEFFYVDSGHWPMYSTDGDTTAFDEKCMAWGSEVIIRGLRSRQGSSMMQWSNL